MSPAISSAGRSTSSDTSAKSRAGREAVPAKITSSIPAPRIDLGEDSPITQRIASNTLDLPQPLGPTTPVRPGSMRSSAGSTKLLKPVSFSRFICMAAPPSASLPLSSRLPDQRFESGPFVGVGPAPVDEEGRRALHAQRRGGFVHLAEPLERRRVADALLAPRGRDAVAGGQRVEPGEIGDLAEPLAFRERRQLRLLGSAEGADPADPFLLGGVSLLHEGEIVRRPRAA